MHLNETWWMTEFVTIAVKFRQQFVWHGCTVAVVHARTNSSWRGREEKKPGWGTVGGERIGLGPQSSQAGSPSCSVWVIGHCVWINHFRYSISGWQQCFITCALAGTHIKFEIHILLFSCDLSLFLSLSFYPLPSLFVCLSCSLCLWDPIFSFWLLKSFSLIFLTYFLLTSSSLVHLLSFPPCHFFSPPTYFIPTPFPFSVYVTLSLLSKFCPSSFFLSYCPAHLSVLFPFFYFFLFLIFNSFLSIFI